MQRATARFTAFLKERGLKLTHERLSVLQGVVRSDGHFDAEELAQVVKDINPKVSRATVYRVIPLLVDAGFITPTIPTKGRISYERVSAKGQNHDHMICNTCGALIEFQDERLDRLIQSICGALAFQMQEFTLSIRGACRACRNITYEQEKT